MQTPVPETATPRERFMAALDRRPLVGRVPHFELVFFLTLEAFGMIHPSHQYYVQWDQMDDKERRLHREYYADCYIRTAEQYEHSAIMVHNPHDLEECLRVMDIIRAKTGDRYFLTHHGDGTWSVPDGDHMEAFSYRLADDPQGLKDEAQRRVDATIAAAERFREHGALDGFTMCADYCFNTGPFFSPAQFEEFVFPYLRQTVEAYREMGFYAIKHTDGNIMPIIDMLVDAGPHALHSLDPQGGVDIAKVKRDYGDRVCLVGNVNCALMDTGTEEQVVESARYALRHGMPGGGYIFSTSNCIYTGMPLGRYELILEVWRREGDYR